MNFSTEPFSGVTLSFCSGPIPLAVVSVPAAVAELVTSRQRRGVSALYLVTLSTCLARLARAFPGPLDSLTAPAVEAYLASVPGAARTRNNHLALIRQLIRWGQRRGHLAPTFNGALAVEPEIERPPEPALYSAADLRALMAAAFATIRPAVALVAWCGLRTAEACRLSWGAVDIDRRLVTVAAGKAKTRSRRLCPVPENAAAWLAAVKGNDCPQSLPLYSGTLKTFHWLLSASLDRAGVTRRRNGLRHSFISYRLALGESSAGRVALDAGTSEGMVFANYRELATAEAAREWFNVKPEEMRLAA